MQIGATSGGMPDREARSTERFSAQDVEAWRRDGATLIPNFFTAQEVASVQADFQKVFSANTAMTALDEKTPGEIGKFRLEQFKAFETVPLDCSAALNLIGVHPALIAFAKAALQTDDVRLYQCQAWAKFTGDADYDQPFHCDFNNHTLTAPSEYAERSSIPFLCYFTDVTDAHGAMQYVTRPDSQKVCGPEASDVKDPAFQAKLQSDMAKHGRSSASGAGSIVAG